MMERPTVIPRSLDIIFASEASRHVTGQFVLVDGGAFTTNYPSTESFARG